MSIDIKKMEPSNKLKFLKEDFLEVKTKNDILDNFKKNLD